MGSDPHKTARIFYDEAARVECVVLDLTSAGAFFEVSEAANVAQFLDLTFDRGISMRLCRVV